MDFNKYKQLLFNNIKKQAKDWFETGTKKNILNEDVYRFVHSIKGTAGTLQLNELYEIAANLLDELNQGDKVWKIYEVRDFLYPILQYSYEYENFEDTEVVNNEEEGNVETQEKPVIHLIDDDTSMLILLKDVLEKQGWTVIANKDPIEATNQYFDTSPDCLIIDLEMPEKNGFEILKDIHEHNEKKFIPKIIISANHGREQRIAAFKIGADDFIAKPIDIEEFIVRVTRHIQRKQLFDKSVLIDELTQVYNRKFLHDIYQRQLEITMDRNSAFTVAMLDIDYFKKVNDTYGHAAGDRVLYHFAQFLIRNISPADTVFRYGGEEFVILFPNSTIEEVKIKLEGILAKYQKIEFNEREQTFTMAFSAGIYTIMEDEPHLETVLEKADQALYKAKNNGRARIEIGNELPKIKSNNKLYVSIIDDEIIIRTILTKIFNTVTSGFEQLDIAVFEDGSKFFESKRHEIDGSHFIVLDGVMPVMDGIEVLQKLKALKLQEKFLILMLTSRKNKNDIERALSLGANDYLTKPFNITELHTRIQHLLQGIE
ncbi:diguanylate cyclase [Paraliobacillus salinarum]|uniref:diguanylate cyclase n=1 Tax=Paraliobacillus salinarum TaxID=1158996 RepID=UPI0015F61742|nr:diguanylate cyclase [Paraliobacillus salinarum]